MVCGVWWCGVCIPRSCVMWFVIAAKLVSGGVLLGLLCPFPLEGDGGGEEEEKEKGVEVALGEEEEEEEEEVLVGEGRAEARRCCERRILRRGGGCDWWQV